MTRRARAVAHQIGNNYHLMRQFRIYRENGMNVDTVIESLSVDDLRAILRSMSEDSSGTLDDLRGRVRGEYRSLPWRSVLTAVPKESLQKICADNGLRSDLSKDELIDQIVASFTKPAENKGLLRDLGSLWMRWSTPGQRGRR